MRKCKASAWQCLVLLLLVCVQANAQCAGTIAFRTSEGKFGIVATKNDRTLASPEYFELPMCSQAVHARGDQFCCATLDEISLWCFNWTLGDFSNSKTWFLPTLRNESVQWPPTAIFITGTTEQDAIGGATITMYSNKAAIIAPDTVPSTTLYRRNETSSLLNVSAELVTGSAFSMTRFPTSDDTMRWVAYMKDGFGGDEAPPYRAMMYTWNDTDLAVYRDLTYATFDSSLQGPIYCSKSHIFGFNPNLETSPILRAVRDPTIINATVQIYNTSLSTKWAAISSTYQECDFLVASINSTSGAESPRLAWAPADNSDPIYLTSPMRYAAIEMIYSPSYPENFIPCSGTSPDPDLFHCVNGQWKSPNSISTGDITISGSITVNGSISIEKSIVFSNPQSTLIVSGCVQINGSIVLTLSSDDIDKIVKGKTTTGELFRSQSCNLGNLNNKEVKLNQKGKKRCEKITATTKTTTDGKGLVAVMKIDKKDCNLWWIILVSVLCGLILITIIILVLVFTLNKSARNCIRPYSKRRTRGTKT